MTVIEDEDRELEDFLARRSVLHRRLADRDYHEPSPELDRLVLERARQAIEVPANAPMYRAPRWALPVALAASVVLALAVVLNVARLRGGDGYSVAAPMSTVETGPGSTADTKAAPITPPAGGAPLAEKARSASKTGPGSTADTKAAPITPPAGAAPLGQQAWSLSETGPGSTADTKPAPTTPLAGGAQLAQQARSASSAAPKARVSSTHTPRFARAEAASEGRVTPARENALRMSEGEGPNTAIARPQPSEAPPPGARTPALADKGAHTDPQAWMRQIEQLRLAGKSADADREIAAFRKAFPQVPVSQAALGRDPRPAK